MTERLLALALIPAWATCTAGWAAWVAVLLPFSPSEDTP